MAEPRPDGPRPPHYSRGIADLSAGVADAAPGSPIEFVVSTTGVQRDSLDLRATGWFLDRYRSNSVVLWCHDHHSEPIGRADNVFSQEQRLRAPIIFDQEDERARRIESKVRRRFISATSVGWDFVDQQGRALEWWRMTTEQMRDEAFYDLLEISVVPVPADPNALAVRQRTALRSLSRELVRLFDDQERPDSDAKAPDVAAAVRAELVRLGIDPDVLTREAPAPGVPGELLVAEPATVRLDEQALAQAIRAAFGDLRIHLDDGHATTTVNPATTSPTIRAHNPGGDDEPPAGVREPAPIPVPPTQDPVARAAVIDHDAAQDVLAAFNI